MAWLGLIPWRFAVALAFVLALLLGVYEIREHADAAGYARGRAEIQLQLDQANAQHAAALLAAQAKHQESVDALAATDQARIALLEHRVAAAAADGDGLRRALRAAVAATIGPPEPTGAAGQPDATAAALGSVSESCSSLAEGLAADAERLADNVRGLQSYAGEVSR